MLDALATREARLAFWINTYNALVVEGIVALGIRTSIWEVPDFLDRIGCRVGDLTFSANEIEHGVLRANRPSPLSTAPPFPAGDPRRAYVITPLEPRIHFAVSCGARSCPRVRTYEPERLGEPLDRATRSFVNREVTLEGGLLVASPIFKWFQADFEERPGGLGGFLAEYLEDGAARRAVLQGGGAPMVWWSYDWRLHAAATRGDSGIA